MLQQGDICGGACYPIGPASRAGHAARWIALPPPWARALDYQLQHGAALGPSAPCSRHASGGRGSHCSGGAGSGPYCAAGPVVVPAMAARRNSRRCGCLAARDIRGTGPNPASGSQGTRTAGRASSRYGRSASVVLRCWHQHGQEPPQEERPPVAHAGKRLVPYRSCPHARGPLSRPLPGLELLAGRT